MLDWLLKWPRVKPMTNVQKVLAEFLLEEEDPDKLVLFCKKFFPAFNPDGGLKHYGLTAHEENCLETRRADVKSSNFEEIKARHPLHVEAAETYEKMLQWARSKQAESIATFCDVHRMNTLANNALKATRDATTQEMCELRARHELEVRDMHAANSALLAEKAATKRTMHEMRMRYDHMEEQMALENTDLRTAKDYAEAQVTRCESVHRDQIETLQEQLDEAREQGLELAVGYHALDADMEVADNKITQGRFDLSHHLEVLQVQHDNGARVQQANHQLELNEMANGLSVALKEQQHAHRLSQEEQQHEHRAAEEAHSRAFFDQRTARIRSGGKGVPHPPPVWSWSQLLQGLLPAGRPARASGDQAAPPATTRAEPATRDTNPGELRAGPSESWGAEALVRRSQRPAGAPRLDWAALGDTFCATLTRLVPVIIFCIVCCMFAVKHFTPEDLVGIF
jgi:hypothetical protein